MHVTRPLCDAVCAPTIRNMPGPPNPAYPERHERWLREYAARHFTDPQMSLAEAAIYLGLSERTARKSLAARNTSWTEIVLELRMERGAHLLETTTYHVEHVARLSGYRSAPAFAKAFRQRFRATPRQYRRGQGGPARAGRPSGASFKAAKRARGEPVERTPGVSAGEKAVEAQWLAELQERLDDQILLEERRTTARMSIEELTSRLFSLRRLTEDPEHWRRMHAEFDAWVEENEARGAQADDGANELWDERDSDARLA